MKIKIQNLFSEAPNIIKLFYLSLIFSLLGCISSAVNFYGLVEVIKYPEGKEPKPDNEYAPVKSVSFPDEYKKFGVVKVQYAHYTGYVKHQIKEEAYKVMYKICDKKYEILEAKQLAERVFQAQYNSQYVRGTGGGYGSAGDVLLTGEIIMFRCVN